MDGSRSHGRRVCRDGKTHIRRVDESIRSVDCSALSPLIVLPSVGCQVGIRTGQECRPRSARVDSGVELIRNKSDVADGDCVIGRGIRLIGPALELNRDARDPRARRDRESEVGAIQPVRDLLIAVIAIGVRIDFRIGTVGCPLLARECEEAP